MKIEIQWEMRDASTDREWVGGVNEMEVRTIAQAEKWILCEIPKRDRGNVEVDAVVLSEIGQFADDEGCPCDRRWIGTYEPAAEEWQWAGEA